MYALCFIYEFDSCPWTLLEMTIDYQNMCELYFCWLCHFSFICVLHNKLWRTSLAVECLNMQVSNCQLSARDRNPVLLSLVIQNSNCINSPCHPLKFHSCATMHIAPVVEHLSPLRRRHTLCTARNPHCV